MLQRDIERRRLPIRRLRFYKADHRFTPWL